MDVKTIDNYTLRMFFIAFTKKRQNQSGLVSIPFKFNNLFILVSLCNGPSKDCWFFFFLISNPPQDE